MIKLGTLGLAAMASLLLVACGGGGGNTTATTATNEAGGGGAATTTSGGGGGGGGSSSTIKLAADSSQIAYDTNSLSAKAGNVKIDFDNPNNSLPHDVCVESQGQKLGCSQVVTGGSSTLDLSNLKAGTYTFYCSVDSHRQAGMEGTLNVQ
jgi:plastocyanin